MHFEHSTFSLDKLRALNATRSHDKCCTIAFEVYDWPDTRFQLSESDYISGTNIAWGSLGIEHQEYEGGSNPASHV